MSVHHKTVTASPTMLGQTGLINMPDARIDEEGTLRFGISYMEPYGVLWSSISFFPWLELSARYTSIDNTTVFEDQPGADFGTDKDKAFDGKIILWPESTYIPQVAFGAHDYFGTQLFRARFLSIGKRIGDVDVTLGYGTDRINRYFGGIRYSPEWLDSWSIAYEYDAYDYANDHRADESGADERRGGSTIAFNYTWGWFGAQLAYQDGTFGVNGFLSIPLMWPEYIPKLEEPAPYTTVTTKAPVSEWRDNPQHLADLVKVLEAQGFKNVRVWLNGSQLEVGVATARISLVARAAGRAVRTALLMSPIGTQTIKITYYELTDLPVVTYTFTDLSQLDLFFSGSVTYGELLNTLKVEYAYPEKSHQLEQHQFTSQRTETGDSGLQALRNDDGHAISLKQTDSSLNSFRIIPLNMGIIFNDPSGAFKYDLFATALYQRYLGHALFFNAGARLQLLENVTDVVKPSNSELPHVRSDVALYKKEKGVKLDSLLINKYFHLQPRVYARYSLGIYEEMFGGSGGQVLYLPKEANWAADLAIDWLRQRDTEGDLQFRDYETATAIASVHYRVKKYGLRFTLRGGRFLAKDSGVRLEFSRRFRSGIKVGAWYSYTDANDTQNPGSADDPYQDKGIFMQIPLNTMLTKDTRAAPDMSLRPWTRDGAQMVKSPGDLYEQFDSALMLDRPDFHLLSGFHE